MSIRSGYRKIKFLISWKSVDMTLAQLTSTYGIKAHIVSDLDDYHRGQEVFIPWNLITSPAVVPKKGTRIAFDCGYNDADKAGDKKRLRWMPPGDPLSAKDGSGTWQPVWGDLIMLNDFPGQQTPYVNSVRQFRGPVRLAAGGASAREFAVNIRGQKVTKTPVHSRGICPQMRIAASRNNAPAK